MLYLSRLLKNIYTRQCQIPARECPLSLPLADSASPSLSRLVAITSMYFSTLLSGLSGGGGFRSQDLRVRFVLAERTDDLLHGVVDDVLQLELVLVVGVSGGKVAELLRQLEALVHVLGRHEVLGYLDTAVQVEHLNDNGVKRGGFANGSCDYLPFTAPNNDSMKQATLLGILEISYHYAEKNHPKIEVFNDFIALSYHHNFTHGWRTSKPRKQKH